jgi:hypothetical protein
MNQDLANRLEKLGAARRCGARNRAGHPCRCPAAKPKDEVEAALVIQMACTHTASMAVLSRIGGAHGGDRHVAMMAGAASKILRAFAIQVETLRRLRAGGSQYMRIEHVHLESNAQAIIGNLQNGGKPNG